VDNAAQDNGMPAPRQVAAVVKAATPSAAAAQNVVVLTEPKTHHVPTAASSRSSEEAVSLGERALCPVVIPAGSDAKGQSARSDATSRAPLSGTRMSSKSSEAFSSEISSDSDSSRFPSADSDQSRGYNHFSNTPAQSSAMPAPSSSLSNFPLLADDAPQPGGNYPRNAADSQSSKEGRRLTAASIVSTSCGLSVTGMSGTQAAAVFMNDAGRTLLIDSASEVKTVV
jgi:hypothetical protein